MQAISYSTSIWYLLWLASMVSLGLLGPSLFWSSEDSWESSQCLRLDYGLPD